MDYLASSITFSFLPPLLTSYAQQALYSSNFIPPQHPQSPQFQRDRKVIYTLLVMAYLTYTVYTAFTSFPPTYYDILQISPGATDSELRSQFKLLSKQFHPDKATSSSETVFLAIRHAYTTLLNPLKRQAYNRFGPLSSQWDLKTEREFLLRGVMLTLVPNYLLSFVALQVWSLFGRAGNVRYWRYLIFLTSLVVEVQFLITPSTYPIFTLLQSLRKISIALTLSLEHLSPLYTVKVSDEVMMRKVEGAMVNALGESSRLLEGEIGPLLVGVEETVEKREVVNAVKEEVVEMMVRERIMKARME